MSMSPSGDQTPEKSNQKPRLNQSTSRKPCSHPESLGLEGLSHRRIDLAAVELVIFIGESKGAGQLPVLLRDYVSSCRVCKDPFAVIECLKPSKPTVILFCENSKEARDLIRILKESNSLVSSILMEESPSIGSIKKAIHLGFSDVLAYGSKPEAIAMTLHRAQASLSRIRELLERESDQLHSDNYDTNRDSDELANFSHVIRQQLDVKSCVLSTINFIRSKVAPVSAAVYLQDRSGDWTLADFSSTDLPSESCRTIFTDLAHFIPVRAEKMRRTLHLAASEDKREIFGDSVECIDGKHLIISPNFTEEECLSVVLLLRDPKASMFGHDEITVVESAAQLMAMHLARIVKIHHRHLPEDLWGSNSDQSGSDT